VIILIFSCSSGNESDSNNIFTDALKMELSFGDDETSLPDEYLLAKPEDLVVNINNDIIVIDEEKIKVYSETGEPKMILGGKGQGPGEFNVLAWKPRISGKGYLSVLDQFYSMNLYSPEYEFLLKESFFNSDYKADISDKYNMRAVIYGFINMDKKIRILYMEGDNKSQPEEPGYSLLGKYDGEKFHEIVRQSLQNVYHIPLNFANGRSITVLYNIRFMGQFLWDYSTEEKIVYVNTGRDYISADKAEYELIVYSLVDNIKTNIVHEYERVPIEKELLDDVLDHPRREAMKEDLDRIKEETLAKKYYASLQQIKTDGKFVFTFTYKQNNTGEVLSDVFDISTLSYLSSLYFNGVPSFIKAGYAYYLRPGTDEEFPKVEKFRIDPAVYK
jgi:hypothetical protein